MAFANADLSGLSYSIDVLLPKEWGGARQRLLRALYGLRLSPRLWYERYRDEMFRLGWSELKTEPGVFFKTCDEDG